MKISSMTAAIAAAVLLTMAMSGCSNSDSGGKDSLDQQRKDVMGSPPPAAERAKIEAFQAAQQQKMQQAQQQQPAPQGKP